MTQHQGAVNTPAHVTQDRKLLIKMVKANGLVNRDFGGTG